MESDTDWVGRDLQRLAQESKLLRAPTEAEWKSIWRAATDWADAYGVVTHGIPIDEFVRKHAPGALREPEVVAADTNSHVVAPTVSSGSPPKPDPRERGRRYPRINGRAKAAGKPAAG